MTIVNLKRLLTEGVEYTGEYIGMNRLFCAQGNEVTRRKVVKNKTQLVSEYLDGPRKGQVTYLDWRGVTVREQSDGIILVNNGCNPPEDFLKITF